MAFNSWDKLTKAQRDYPKVKFALSVVEKGLKKTPRNVFLLAWKADLYLQENRNHAQIIPILGLVNEALDMTDTQFLSYVYRLAVEASRRATGNVASLSSIGNTYLKPWVNAAASKSKNVRVEIWDELFKTAMREDCWEDVRFAVINLTKDMKDDAPSKRSAFYTRMLATQFSAEQMNTAQGTNMAALNRTLVIRWMTQAYNAPPSDPIAVKDIRDLRFMAEIFRRQDKCAELFSLWDEPPDAMKDLMWKHEDDLNSLKTRLIIQQEKWPLLEAHFVHCIDRTKSNLNQVKISEVGKSERLWELCAWNSDLWDGLINAMEATYPMDVAINKISYYMKAYFGANLEAKDRPLRLTSMKLSHFVGAPMLSDCKEYWEHHHAVPSCFADLRPFLETLAVQDAEDFIKFTQCETRALHAKIDIDECVLAQWQQAQLNVLKVGYLFAVSLPANHTAALLEGLICKAIEACTACPQSSDGGFLAIYTLLHLHHHIILWEDSKDPFEVTPNSRLLLQATMLARHLVEGDKNKENRTMCLLAARLHLNLGLGLSAFRLYGYTKCKEMLLDTLSPYILSRISLTHPFDSQGYQGFSADDELTKVINAIEKMEKKTDAFIYTDMPSFLWDQAADGLQLKRKLKSSLTKHICVNERRRIARFKGKSTVGLPRLDYKTYDDISNNVDLSVFPDYEESGCDGPLSIVMPLGILSMDHLISEHVLIETTSKALYQEGHVHDLSPLIAKVGPNIKLSILADDDSSLADRQVYKVWMSIRVLLEQIILQEGLDRTPHTAIMNGLKSIRKAMEKLRMPGATVLRPEDEPTMFHENMLLSSYRKLEVLCTINKLVETLREKVVNSKSTHPLKTRLSRNWVDELATEMQICYQTIRDVAESYITLIRTKGLAAIKAQVRWGKTGEKLKNLLSDDDIAYYADEYVESALEAWKGVLKVKLKY